MAEARQRTQGQAMFAKSIRTWLGLGMAAFLAACAVVPKGPPSTTDAPPTQPNGPVSGLPTDATRHRVALLVPLSGTNAGVGESIANAATLAVLDTSGKAIRVTTYDTAGGAAAAAQKAISDGNRLILGPLLAEDVRAVSPIARASGIPIISFSNDISVAGQGTYLMGFIPNQSVDRIVSFARSRGMTRFAGLVPTGIYGQRTSAALTGAVQAFGGQMVKIESFDRNPASIQAAVSRLASSSAYDALMIADSGRIALQIVPQIRRSSGKAARILGTELWNTEGSLAQNGPMQGAWFASVSDAFYNQLGNKYRARFGKSPFRLASLGYDSVLLVNKIAGVWRVGTPFPYSALTDPGGFSGIDGAFRFRTNGLAERSLEVQQINPGGFAVIAPAPKMFAQ